MEPPLNLRLLMTPGKSKSMDRSGAEGVPQVLTIGEAAEFLRCSKAHLQNLLAGRVAGAAPLPFIPIGRRKLIRRESLFRWMDRAEATKQC
jgi:excisionase family DNA binding protein